MAVMSRGAPGPAEPPSALVYMEGLDAQAVFRRQWARLFETFDVVLAPPFGVVAFPHDERPIAERTHLINGEVTSYLDQVAWPGIATFPKLPSTAAPIGTTKTGLPIGVQIIGPYLEDRTTIAFAGMIEREFG